MWETKTLTKTDLYISCQTISNRDSSKRVFKTLVETTIIGGVFRLSLNLMKGIFMDWMNWRLTEYERAGYFT